MAFFTVVRTQKWFTWLSYKHFKLSKVPASAIMTSSVLNIMLSLVTYLAVFILKIIESTRDIGRALNNLFLVFPQVCFQKYLDISPLIDYRPPGDSRDLHCVILNAINSFALQWVFLMFTTMLIWLNLAKKPPWQEMRVHRTIFSAILYIHGLLNRVELGNISLLYFCKFQYFSVFLH